MARFPSSVLAACVRRPLRSIRIVVGLGCLFVLAFLWRDLILAQDAAEAGERERIRAEAAMQARAAGDSIQATINSFDFVLRSAREAVLAGPKPLDVLGRIVTESIAQDLVIQLFHIDDQGFPSYSSLGPVRTNFLGDRAYFRSLAGATEDRLVVSDVVLGRLSNKWSIQFARRVTGADGAFRGVVSLAVSPDAWVAKLKSFELGQSDLFAVLSADGAYLMRTLYGGGYYGKYVPPDRPFLLHPEQMEGDYVTSGALDGINRQFSWVRLPSGLIVAMGIGLDEALAPVQRLNHQSFLRALVLSSLLLLASAALVVALGRYEKVVEASQEREAHYRSVFDNMAEGIMVVDAHERISGINPAFTAITGYGLDEVVGRSPALLSPSVPGARNLGTIIGRHPAGSWDDDFDGLRWNGETYTGHVTLSVVRGTDGRMANRIVLLADVTERRRKDEEIWRQANFDILTGLPNRALMMDGDLLLCEVARRLEALFRDEDTVARMGGDEFVVLMPRNADKAAVEATATKIVESLSRPFQIGDQALEISCSVGIARFPDDGDTAAVLLHKADVAMYRAKEMGRATWST
ncbi:MAG: diguanylate cyclase [Betaproteobacteria bacterium HGW-Betaproteobacteria-13]|nr:MAG: diguanylate cyclase [Betaproteobacteria bacterium HGW-Betaproteobacteria-13]